MRTRIMLAAAAAATLALSLTSASSAAPAPGNTQAQEAGCAAPLVDDFSSGAYRSPEGWKSGLLDSTQTGTMIGKERFTRLSVPSNVYGFPSTLAINPNGGHLLVLSSGYKAFAGVLAMYGLKSAGVAAPLHANLTCYGRFRVTFQGADLSLAPIVIVYYLDPVTRGGRYGECQAVLPSGSTAGYTADFAFGCFKDGAGRPVADWTDISQIGLLVTAPGAIGAHDYAITKIELV